MKKEGTINKRKAVAAMRWFLNELVKEYDSEKKISIHDDNAFAAFIAHDRSRDFEKYFFSYSIEQLQTSGIDYKNGTGYVCANMTHRAPFTRGFAQITRILLHEFGHQMTYDDVMRLYGGSEEMSKFYRGTGGLQARYIRVPAEWVATQWGIEWLKIPEHRKIAKQFEKKFFACFE